MSSINVIAVFSILLLLQSMSATSNFLSPIFDDACKKVECGKGKCKASNSSFFYECECDPGWTQTRSKNDDSLKFLPCIVPNCTFNSDCSAAAPPVQDKATNTNQSVFDLCRWVDCGGGGTCNKTSPVTYSCNCAAGYYNLFNVSSFTCYKECAIGMDCKDLGISMPNSTSPAPAALADKNSNQAGLNLIRNHHWLSILVMLLSTVW